jgi:hypothetical protein
MNERDFNELATILFLIMSLSYPAQRMSLITHMYTLETEGHEPAVAEDVEAVVLRLTRTYPPPPQGVRFHVWLSPPPFRRAPPGVRVAAGG